MDDPITAADPRDDVLAELDRLVDDEARDRVVVIGADAATYLQSQLSQEIRPIEVGGSRWTLILEPTGKVHGLARLRREDEDRFVLDIDAGFGDDLAARLRRFLIRVDASIVVEPAVRSEPRPDIEARRVACGWPRMGAEIVPGETIPASTGVVAVAVDFAKGCYPGQELVERMDSRGADAPRVLRVLEVGDEARVGDPIIDAAGTDVGSLTSVAGGIGLGYVQRSADVGSSPRYSQVG